MVKNILIVFGTRPEAIKMAPLVKAILNDKNIFNLTICVTAQHRSMLDQVLEIFNIIPDVDLDIMTPGQNLFDISTKLLLAMQKVIMDSSPDIVLVHGDTTTAYSAALAAFYLDIPVGHVEAGLRSFDMKAPFPEEFNRKTISNIASLHFAPTEISQKNLMSEGVKPSNIFITGNTVIDALKTTIRNTIDSKKNILSSFDFDFKTNEYVLITGHRRENFGEGFLNICKGIRDLSEIFPEYHFVYPVHLNPNVQNPVNEILSNKTNIHLLPPLSYDQFCLAMHYSTLILTDSGGIQEEGISIDKPVILMREITERPEALEAGGVKLVGTDRKKIVRVVSELLSNKNIYEEMASATNPFGDGNAAQKIVSILRNFD